jgi:hypothetical protein
MTEPHHNSECDAVSAGLRQTLLDIHIYQSKHPIDEISQQSVETLIDIGALSPRTIAFIKSHHPRFYGFPERIAPDITVLDVILGDRRLIGYADGHVELVMPKDEPAVCGDDAA